MSPDGREVRLALPSRGRMEEETLEFLRECGLEVRKPGPRRYSAIMPGLPFVSVVFQRARDIPRSLSSGDVDLGITGLDSLEEARAGGMFGITVVHEALGFGSCRLALAVPEDWADVRRVTDLPGAPGAGRIATRHPCLAGRFLEAAGLSGFEIVGADGALESAPSVGYADLIADLVSSGETIRENRLKLLEDGVILESEAVLAGCSSSLETNPLVLSTACTMLEYVEARLRGRDKYLVFANMRGCSPDEIAARMSGRAFLGGLQGPTVSRVLGPPGSGWWAVNIVVPSSGLYEAIEELRASGGSGVVVTPVRYVFEERPDRCARLLDFSGRRRR
ncbi:ATP phosphoribosyltransferase [Candidatus Fermentibacteria bacterium]|nr:ATP phosphoribosyltransferase [Candidatus Fermentibacteria bacterium]